jgi:hypothetical protein
MAILGLRKSSGKTAGAKAPTVLRALLELEGVGLCAREAQQGQQAAEGERARTTQ